MLWLVIMALLILWLLGYGYAVGGGLIHLLLGVVLLLFLILLLNSDPAPVLFAKLLHRRLRGTIRFFNPYRGFGFIERKHGCDVFFLLGDADTRTHLYPGAQVEFDLDENRFAARAKHILLARQQGSTYLKRKGSTVPRILSISRNPRLLAARNHALALAGYTVAAPREPEEAVLFASQQRYDAVVIGHSVERETREDVICGLRDLQPDLPILFVYTEPKLEEPLADVNVDVTAGSTPLVDALHQRLRRAESA